MRSDQEMEQRMKEARPLIKELFAIWKIAKYTQTQVAQCISMGQQSMAWGLYRGAQFSIIVQALSQFAHEHEGEMKRKLKPIIHITLEELHQKLYALADAMRRETSSIENPPNDEVIPINPNKEIAIMPPTEPSTSCIQIILTGLKEKQRGCNEAQRKFLTTLAQNGIYAERYVTSFTHIKEQTPGDRSPEGKKTIINIVLTGSGESQKIFFAAYQTFLAELAGQEVHIDEQNFFFHVDSPTLPATPKVKGRRETATSRTMDALSTWYGKTRKELADLLDITEGQVTRYRNGEHGMKKETALRILKRLEELENKPPEDILNLLRMYDERK